MRKGEARELVGMFTTLAVLVTIGAGLSSVVPQLSDVTDIELPVESPAVEAQPNTDEPTTPVRLAPGEGLPELLRIYEAVDSADPAEPAPRLPDGLAIGV